MFLRAFATSIVLILAGGSANLSKATGFDFKAGIGYDFLSQEYFLDSASRAGVDSTFTDWSLRTRYLDDLKGLFSVSFSPFPDRHLQLTSSYEQTPDFIRVKLLGDLRCQIDKSKLDLTGEMDWRNKYNDSARFGDSYLFGYANSRLSVPVSRSLAITARLRGEFVDFDSPATLSYNYYRIGAKIGVEKLFENFSFGDVRLTLDSRQVPDSTELNYITCGLESAYVGFYRQGELDFYARLESKDYKRPADKGDYLRIELNGRHKLRLGEKAFIHQDIQFELTDFDPSDPVSRDYVQIGLTLLTGIEGEEYSFGLGPDIELLREEQDRFQDSEDYFEAGAKVAFDLLKTGRFFGSFESVVGHRNLVDDNELLTDFTFERLNLIGDLKLLGGLNLSFLFSAEWEWHEIEANNSNIYLLSSGLTCSF